MPGIKTCIFLLLLFVFFTAEGQSGQQTSRISLGYPVYSQYLQNGFVINPAYAGSLGALSGFLSYRMQWMGIDGAPALESVSLHTPLKNERIGLGFIGQFMQYGFTRSTSIYASYAYNIKIWHGKLSFGLKAGADISNTVFPEGVFLDQPGDPAFVNSKPYILPNIGAGAYYFNDRLFAGFSIPAFLSYESSTEGSVQPYHSFSDYQFLVTGGALFVVSNRVKFKPSLLMDFYPGGTKMIKRFDLNCNFILSDMLWLGASWRTTEQVIVGILQVQISQQLMVGLSYDYPAGRMNSYSKGSSEFILRYEFGSRVSAANPRYF
jgi:type IX secretion system PorP/SprF family membrane protein